MTRSGSLSQFFLPAIVVLAASLVQLSGVLRIAGINPNLAFAALAALLFFIMSLTWYALLLAIAATLFVAGGVAPVAVLFFVSFLVAAFLLRSRFVAHPLVDIAFLTVAFTVLWYGIFSASLFREDVLLLIGDTLYTGVWGVALYATMHRYYGQAVSA
jgi:hypothetical protein